eukprot:scaffold65812_cov63-Phaeocystis_antarctica.AAC.4
MYYSLDPAGRPGCLGCRPELIQLSVLLLQELFPPVLLHPQGGVVRSADLLPASRLLHRLLGPSGEATQLFLGFFLGDLLQRGLGLRRVGRGEWQHRGQWLGRFLEQHLYLPPPLALHRLCHRCHGLPLLPSAATAAHRHVGHRGDALRPLGLRGRGLCRIPVRRLVGSAGPRWRGLTFYLALASAPRAAASLRCGLDLHFRVEPALRGGLARLQLLFASLLLLRFGRRVPRGPLRLHHRLLARTLVRLEDGNHRVHAQELGIAHRRLAALVGEVSRGAKLEQQRHDRGMVLAGRPVQGR